MLRRFTINAVLCLFGLALVAVLTEGLLRTIGFKPWSYETKDANEPTMHEPKSELGWRNKEGNYTLPPYHSAGKAVQITFLENGLRRTSASPVRDYEGEIIIVGGSFTQGWALDDNKTYAWKLQEKYDSMNVLNYGTGGYGTYQSLLVLERELPKLASPRFTLYGFIDDHEARNVATSRWLRVLTSFSRRGQVEVPFATFDEKNGLTRQNPARYLLLPFSESSALITLCGRAYGRLVTRKRYSQKKRVTEEILLQMNRVSEKHGATFFAVLLQTDDRSKRHYIKFFNENNIKFIDCSRHLTDDMIIPGEGHPNEKLNAWWARCIQSTLNI
jgi:hypothetical protein